MYKLILKLFGESIESIRLAAAIYNAFTLAALYCLVRASQSLRAAWSGAFVFGIFSTCPLIEGFTANAELFTVLPLVLSAYLTWKKKWIWAGFLSGLAFFLKPIGVSGLILTLSWMILMKARWQEFFKASGAFFVVPILSVAHGIIIGWDHFWYSFAEQKLASDTLFSIGIRSQISSFAHKFSYTLPATIVPLSLALLGTFKSKRQVKIFGILWVITTLVGMSLGGNWHWHYFIQLIPPLAFLSGAAIAAFPTLSLRSFWVVVLTSSFLYFCIKQLPHWFLSPKSISQDVYKRLPYLVDKDIAEYISSNTKSHESIYVAFYQADIYYLSKRKAAVPQQLYRYQLLSSQKVFQQILNSIRQKKPAMVIWINYPPEWISAKEFLDFLRERYTEVKKFPYDIVIYKRR